jgi:hypothetical protein
LQSSIRKLYCGDPASGKQGLPKSDFW